MPYRSVLLLVLALGSYGLWAQPPQLTPKRADVKPFQYQDAKVPFYPAGGKKSKVDGPLTRMQLPVTPAESVQHMITPVEFEVRLFAAEPQIRRPICMAWDERGRLWIGESVDYPNQRQLEGQGHDRIVICDDSDGDGRADKFTVFADKLSIPTSLAFARGGVIVHQAPHTLFLQDTDGDDVADQRSVLFTGWSTGDTHAGPSNLRYGMDNWFWGVVGYAGFSGTIGGENHNFRTGLYRFHVPASAKDNKPDAQGLKFEFLRNTNNNTWGLGFSEEGHVFASTANGNPSVYLPIANRYYEGVRGWSSRVLGGIAGNAPMQPITDKVRQVDYHGHFTAAAGHALYTARLYPRYYWNRAAFIAEPTGHLLANFLIEPKGADFVSYNAWNLLASDDEWTAPTMAEVGPDGCVWVIDWYNYIVQHNPTPAGFKTGKGNAYETDLRDKTHGRIYRLVPKGVKLPPRLDLAKAKPEDLVATLKNDNMFWRLHAQRLLVERGNTDVAPALIELAKHSGVDEAGLNPAVMHALWTLHGLGGLTDRNPQALAVVVKALGHKSAGVRRSAVQVLPRTADLLPTLAPLLQDADAQVRLATFLALAETPPDVAAGQAIVKVFTLQANADDAWIPDAASAAAARHDVHFLKALADGKGPLSLKTTEIVARVAEHYARSAPSDTLGPLLESLALGRIGNPSSPDPRLVEVVIAGLAKGWPRSAQPKLPPSTEKALLQLLPKLSAGSKGQLLRLASLWGSQAFAKNAAEIVLSLHKTLVDDKENDADRIAAARQLVELQAGDAKLVSQILEVVSPRASPALAGGLLGVLGEAPAAVAAPALLKQLPSLPPSAKAVALQVLLSRPESTRLFLQAVDQGKATLADLSLDQKQSLAAHPDLKLAAFARKLLERGGGLPSADRQKLVDELLHLTNKTGDHQQGKLVFKKVCAACHTHSGEGAKVGPDLTGTAAHPRHEMLIHILDPNRSVEGNYRAYVVETQDGKVLSGLLTSETKNAVELIDSQAQKHLILRENIEQMSGSSKSLMPEGFEKQLSPDDLVNLLEFLARRGRFLPLSLEKVASAVSVRGMFNSEDSKVERLVFADWSPKVFDGIPFHLVDPRNGQVANVLMLYGPQGKIPPRMPRSATLPCNTPAKAIHLLSGVSGWGFPLGQKGSVSLIVRLVYDDGQTEDHPLKNGEHFADYVRRIDVPGSKFAFDLAGRQVRYLAIIPRRTATIARIEFLKGEDRTAPVIMAVTVETRE